MSRKTAPNIDIVKLEDKEDKLRRFIVSCLDRQSSGALAGVAPTPITIVARSCDSPVVKAVMALARSGSLSRPVKAVLAILDDAEIAARFAGLSNIETRRLGRDARLLDAHEQIVLDTASSWVGDCMRRDPNKRDAYECFAGDCATTARWATISFQRLWHGGELRKTGRHDCPTATLSEACLSAATAEDGQAGPSVSSGS